MSTLVPGEDTGAAVEAIEGGDVVGPWEDHDVRSLDGLEGAGSLAVSRRGLAASPALRSGLLLTAAMALATSNRA